MITFGIKDIIDILLVATLLFYIYQLMKRSSAANIFAGIIVFVITWILVSQIFNMKLLGTIFDKLVSMGMIALVIVFQEEIRRFFSSVGTRSSAFRYFYKKSKQSSNHEEIGRAHV